MNLAVPGVVPTQMTKRLYIIVSSRSIHGSRITALGWGSLDLLIKGAEGDVRKNNRIEVDLIASR
ncbi:MAG TPA: hypothetical protein VIQ51_03105 [Chryseosolibacter sp.]